MALPAYNPARVSWRFSRSGGKGGQNVNKVETRAELLYDAAGDEMLRADVRERLQMLAGSRLRDGGIIAVVCDEARTQEENRALALERLEELLERAAVKPKSRRKTKPTRASKERRLSGKKRDSEKKAGRSSPRGE
jgi:ribosome-associated protein